MRAPPVVADAIRAIEESGLLDYEGDVAHACLNDNARPFAAATDADASDLALAIPTDAGGFCVHYLDVEATRLVARVLANRPSESREELPLLEQALAVLDEVASACDVDPKLRARISGLDMLRAKLRERVGS